MVNYVQVFEFFAPYPEGYVPTPQPKSDLMLAREAAREWEEEGNDELRWTTWYNTWTPPPQW